MLGIDVSLVDDAMFGVVMSIINDAILGVEICIISRLFRCHRGVVGRHVRSLIL